jgi:hypothetical protein
MRYDSFHESVLHGFLLPQPAAKSDAGRFARVFFDFICETASAFQ